MKTFIKVRLFVEGIHCYPNAIEDRGESVSFLSFPHRHRFFVTALKQVNHDDRDKEFILLQREVKKWLETKYYDEKIDCCNFKTCSCEMIAKKILQAFEFDSVEVNEDEENGAIVTIDEEEVNNDNENVFVIGKAFAGKSTFVQQVYQDPKYQILEVGDIVREFTGKKERVFDKSLNQFIVGKIQQAIMKATSEKKVLVVVGCRSVEILEHFQNVEIVLIVASKKVREARFQENVLDQKNVNESFESIEKQEHDLGIDDLISYITNERIEDLDIRNNNL